MVYKPLKALDKTLLLAIGRANNFSLSKHSTIHVIRNYYPKELKKEGKIISKMESRSFGRLESKKLIKKHSTGKKLLGT
ncbi:MAG: hypothetical protein HeimC3_34060 [Candidatus Heimdallarchaeota archaeon LC_3]|nr:MAG: hypothetical protein HeimC3_34060 [Candidatus Heimdallarchaeota archaeon LC_3]